MLLQIQSKYREPTPVRKIMLNGKIKKIFFFILTLQYPCSIYDNNINAPNIYFRHHQTINFSCT